ncbi:MAG: SLBB domain-containing protein [Campylobacterota bacterium]|nr:SLBB domain-containing protein [Campylobacterota bacterium]
MFTRVLSLFLILTLSLFAVPSIDQLKAAVKADPSLLDSPQAQAMMQEKGISATDVKSRLAKSEKMSDETMDAESIENNVDLRAEDAHISEDFDMDVDDLNESVVQRLNPFEYKTSQEIREDLHAKKQLLLEEKLARYSDSFYANKNMIDSSSLATPDDYVITPGDTINIHVYGDKDKNYNLSVSNDGEVEIAYIGPIKVAGMSFKELKATVSSKLKRHFKNSLFKISIEKYSSIQVTLIGDVKYPGIYNLPSFATAKDLFIEAKGVRKSASVRDIDIKRNGKTVASLDFYDLLFKGKSAVKTLLKHGDIVVVKKAKQLVSIDGFVNHAAIFELKSSETLKELIAYAGGMKADASKRHIKIDRFSDNTISETFHLNYKKAKNFKMRDGDKVYIYQLNSSADSSVNIYGNVIRPGSYRIPKEATLTSLLKEQLSRGAKQFFLPETYFEYAMVKRYSKSLDYEINSFRLQDILDGKNSLKVLPQDEIYIFSHNDVQTTSFVTTKGEILLNPGKLRYFKGMSIRDAVHASGVDGIIDDSIRVTTINTEDRMPRTTFYSLKKDADTLLSAYDEVEVYDYYTTHILSPVSIKGEVVNPTTIFYEEGMTLDKLLTSSGGFTIEAYLNKLEVVRYYIDENSDRKKRVILLDLKEIDPRKYKLEAYDEVTVYKIPNWGEKRVVTLSGEVKFPGKYTVSNGEKLSSVIERAGGFTTEAFIEGTVFTRESIKQRQITQYNRSLARIKRELAIYNAMPANAKAAVGNASDTLNDVMMEAKKYQPIGRVSLELSLDIESFKESKYDLVLKDQDTVTVPNMIDTVTVFGEVFNPTSFVYNEDLDAQEYIEMASGLSRSADEGSIYVIHADGTSELVDQGWFSSSVKIQKGDTVVVPLYIKEYNTLEVWNSVSRVLSSFAVTAAALTTLGVF